GRRRSARSPPRSTDRSTSRRGPRFRGATSASRTPRSSPRALGRSDPLPAAVGPLARCRSKWPTPSSGRGAYPAAASVQTSPSGRGASGYRRTVLTRRLARWLDDRLGASRFARSALDKAFPDHWSFMVGEIALYCFVVLVLTGIFLSFFFDPSPKEVVYHGAYNQLDGVRMSEAYRSTVSLSFDVRAGLVMRQM